MAYFVVKSSLPLGMGIVNPVAKPNTTVEGLGGVTDLLPLPMFLSSSLWSCDLLTISLWVIYLKELYLDRVIYVLIGSQSFYHPMVARLTPRTTSIDLASSEINTLLSMSCEQSCYR